MTSGSLPCGDWLGSYGAAFKYQEVTESRQRTFSAFQNRLIQVSSCCCSRRLTASLRHHILLIYNTGRAQQMNMKTAVLCLCLFGMVCALPAYRSKRSASAEDSHQSSLAPNESNDSDDAQTFPTTTDVPSDSHDTDSDPDSDDHDSDSSEEDLPVTTTSATSTEDQTSEAYTPDPFTRGDNAGRGDSMANEIRAADDADNSVEVKAWQRALKSYEADTQDNLDTTAEQTDDLDDDASDAADKASVAVDDNSIPDTDASSHQDSAHSSEDNSQEDGNLSQPDHSVEVDSHPDSHSSNESPEQHVQLRGLKQTTVVPDTEESSESSQSQEDSLPQKSSESQEVAL